MLLLLPILTICANDWLQPTGENGATRAPICVELQRDASLSSKAIVLQIDSKSQQISASEFSWWSLLQCGYKIHGLCQVRGMDLIWVRACMCVCSYYICLMNDDYGTVQVPSGTRCRTGWVRLPVRGGRMRSLWNCALAQVGLLFHYSYFFPPNICGKQLIESSIIQKWVYAILFSFLLIWI